VTDLLFALACGGAGCSDGNAPGAAPEPEPAPARIVWTPPAPVNVVFIVVDTLRADTVLDAAGRYDTPNLDRLAGEGVVFERAFSAAPMTLPSHMSLFSSRSPFETKVLNNGQPVPRELPLLAEWMGQQGYETHAVISLGTLNPVNKKESSGRGFEHYDLRYKDLAVASETSLRLSECLAGRDPARPLFLFAHFADPHEPYNAHGATVREAAVTKDGKLLERFVISDTNRREHEIELGPGRTVFEFTPVEPLKRFRVRRFECIEGGKPLPVQWEAARQMQGTPLARLVVDRGEEPAATCTVCFWLNDEVPNDEVRRRYAAEVAYVDRAIGQLFAELERLGLYRDSLIVFTSDHGEGLGEQRLVGHVERLSDELIHVPLIVRLPAADPRGPELARAARGLVSHLDLVPTLLEAVALPPLPGQRGASLFASRPAAVHIAQTHRPEAQRTQIALRDERFKMVYFPADAETKPPQAERFELYDLVADSAESRNVFLELASERPDWPERLNEIYLLSQLDLGTGGGGETDEERRAREEMLQALGYGGAASPD
jgi:arylsulfatase A-like enzyme